jgi:hypothetical protein
MRETGTGQQVAQLHERYMMMIIIIKRNLFRADLNFFTFQDKFLILWDK